MRISQKARTTWVRKKKNKTRGGKKQKPSFMGKRRGRKTDWGVCKRSTARGVKKFHAIYPRQTKRTRASKKGHKPRYTPRWGQSTTSARREYGKGWGGSLTQMEFNLKRGGDQICRGGEQRDINLEVRTKKKGEQKSALKKKKRRVTGKTGTITQRNVQKKFTQKGAGQGGKKKTPRLHEPTRNYKLSHRIWVIVGGE